MRKTALCAGTCGRQIIVGPNSLPEGEAVCQPCRRRRRGRAEPKPCVVCGKTIAAPTAGEHARATCSAECYAARMREVSAMGRAALPPARKCFCEICGVEYKRTYSKQRTCGRACGMKIHSRVVNAARIKAQPKQPKPRSCTVCCCSYIGTSTAFCSEACRLEQRRRKDREYNQQRACAQWDRSPRVCPKCSEQFDPTYKGQAYCTNACMKSARRRRERDRGTRHSNPHRERAKKYGRKYEHVSPQKVFERDGWICQLCRKPVPKGKRPPDPLAPTLDHIIPMSVEGGDHVYENVQLAHFICNARRGTKGIVQLLLLG